MNMAVSGNEALSRKTRLADGSFHFQLKNVHKFLEEKNTKRTKQQNTYTYLITNITNL